MSFIKGHSSVVRAVSLSFGAKLWSMVNIPIQLLLISSFFSEELQGYYFTFQSICTLLLFAELGLSSVIVYFVSHEWAFCSFDENGGIAGDEKSRGRLIFFGRLIFRWYLIAACLFALLLALGGLYFFNSIAGSALPWKGPFLMLVAVWVCNLLLIPAIALVEGCNQVNAVYSLRMGQSLILGLTTWGCIWGGAGLWTNAVAWLAFALFTLYFLYNRYRGFFYSLLQKPEMPERSWTRGIWPLQWRVGLTFLAGYSIFSLFSPVVLYFYGPSLAGQVGMTLVIAGGLAGFCNIWTLVYTPQFGQLISRSKRDELDRLFSKVVKLTCLFTLVATTSAWGIIKILQHYECRIGDRLLPSPALEAFLAGNIFFVIGVPFAVYMRAHKEEPLLVHYVVFAAAASAGALVCGKYFTIVHMGQFYACATLITLLAIIRRWISFRRGHLLVKT